MIKDIEDLLRRRVRWATCVTDERHLEWNPGIEPTLGDVLGIFRSDRIDEGLDGGCWCVKFADEAEAETVARLGTGKDDWYHLGPWGPEANREAARCGFVRGPEGLPPTPQWRVGEVLYRSRTSMVEDKRDCPDCEGTGEWTATSKLGEEFRLRCPRCDGRRTLSKRVPGATADLFHVRSIEARTASGHRGSAVTYYDSAGCCGVTAASWELFPTKEEALAFSEPRARRERAKLEEREREKGVEDLRMWSVTNAAIREAEAKERRTGYALSDLRERIAKLTDEADTQIGGRPIGDDFEPSKETSGLWDDHAVLPKEALRAVQNELMRWYAEDAAALDEWRRCDS